MADRWPGISFRRVERGDFPLLGRWLAEPHVARWWDHEFTPEAVERDFGPSADGEEPNEDHLVLLGGRPVGLVQFSRFADYPQYVDELAPVLAVPPGAASIDYFVGEPELVGRGLGTALVRRFVDHVWAEAPDVTCLVVPVNAGNVASWRMLRSAGFVLVAEGELEPDNAIDDRAHLVLRLDRPLPGTSAHAPGAAASPP